MKRFTMCLATAAVICMAAASTAVAADAPRPATNPADPTKPIKINPNQVYPLQADPSALSEGTPTTDGGVTSLATPTRMYVSLRDSVGGSNGWARVRVKPGDLVEGNAKTYTTFDRQVTDGGSWSGGYFFGDIDGCGWVLYDNISPKDGTPTSACSSPSRNRTDVGWAWNGYSNCQPDGSCDGSGTSATCNPIPEYANVRPWGTTSPGTLIRSIWNPGNNWQVMWRYATRDNNWLMVRDPHIDNNDGNWVFIPRSCVSYYPGAQYMSN